MKTNTYRLRHDLFGLDKGTIIDFGFSDEARVRTVDNSGNPQELVFDRSAVETSGELFEPQEGQLLPTKYELETSEPQQEIIMSLQQRLSKKLDEADELIEDLRELVGTLRLFLDEG